MGARLYVANLLHDLTKKELREFFREVARPKEIKLMTDPDSGQNRGFAFVEMFSETQAHRAIIQLKGKILQGLEIVISQAREKVGTRSQV